MKFICTQCGTHFNTEDKEASYQVNDNDEQTYCSYPCSASATVGILGRAIESGKVTTITQVTEILAGT